MCSTEHKRKAFHPTVSLKDSKQSYQLLGLRDK